MAIKIDAIKMLKQGDEHKIHMLKRLIIPPICNVMTIMTNCNDYSKKVDP